MAYRDIPTTEGSMKAFLRDVLDRLERLEGGGATAGRASFGETIVVGGVEIIVTDTGGGNRTVTFRSPAGVTSQIVL